MRFLILLTLLLLFTVPLRAEYFLTLGYNYTTFQENKDLGIENSLDPMLNMDFGYITTSGVHFAFRYNHLVLDDLEKTGRNVRVVAIIPELGIGYRARLNKKWQWWLTAWPGYAVSTRYRWGVTDYKGKAFSFGITTAAYYQLKGRFYCGAEVGWRQLTVKLNEETGALPLANNELALNGLFGGISLKHIF